MNTEIKLEMRNISKWFPGVRALSDVNFSLKKGTAHVLCGENGAGKSTLMKILDGIYQPDEGEIYIDGRKVEISNPIQARKNGIAMIFQELTYVPDLTIAENIYLGHWPMLRKGKIDWNVIRTETEALLERENLSYLHDTKMRSLSVSDIQLIEIIKAVNYNAEIIIMDEPTSALTENEVERLFKKIEYLKKQGVSVIYISHKLDEVFRIANEITVLRDGEFVRTMPIEKADEKSLIELMVGREISNQFPKETVKIREELLHVKNLTKEGKFKNISFYLKAGEIVGFSGLMGSGRTEVMRALFGLDPYDGGSILVKGKELKCKNVSQSIRTGITMLTEDRRRYGIVPMRSVEENIVMSSLRKFIYNLRFHKKEERKAVHEVCQAMNVKTPTLETKISSLSGGNQQKVLLAKWLLCDPEIMILDEPTRGIDVGSKNEIYQLMVSFVREGKGIIMVSSEMPELIGMCDRIYVMHEGTITGMLVRSEFSQKAIMSLALSNEK